MEVRITGQHGSLAGGLWYVGRAGNYHFEALVFAEPSQYGIDGGQVSKLYVWAAGARNKRGESLAAYERGWELEPEEGVRGVVETLVAELSRREREGRQGE
jgi:hypothetical protein